MFARVIEVMLAIWLALSPFIFRHPVDARFLWVNDFACATLVALFALLSYARALQHLHLLNGLVGLWLVLSAFLVGDIPPEPGYQNFAATGLLLMMLAIVPSRSQEPPAAWRRYHGQP